MSTKLPTVKEKCTIKNQNLYNQQLSTPIPFTFPMPGGRFYVDQHVSHGYYGRDLADPESLSSIVYDPNVLQR